MEEEEEMFPLRYEVYFFQRAFNVRRLRCHWEEGS
jgi:hypothetical protein